MQLMRCAGLLAGVCGLIAGFATTAHAQTGDVGPTYVYRPLVLPEGILRIDAGPRRPFAGQVWDTGQLQFQINREFQDFAYLVPGAAYGIMDRLEVGAVWPLMISPDLDLLDLSAYGKYELQLGKVDIAAYGEVRIPIESDFELGVGVPIYVHLSDTLRLDTGGFMRIIFGDDVTIALTAPLALAVQATRDIFIGPELAIEIYDFDEVNVPLGVFGGYTLRDGGRTLGDLIGRFAMVDVEHGFDSVRFDLGVNLYFDP
jgi:hypothetical protein